MSIAELRKEYHNTPLTDDECGIEPFSLFTAWFDQACTAALPEPNAMIVSTISQNFTPHSRVVLLKGFDTKGFTFYTNYQSTKGEDIAAHPQVALLFHWVELERQVRIEGSANKLSAEESDAYFALRPRGAQLGAHASLQSSSLASRTMLEDRMVAVEREFEDKPIPRPLHWGGYRVTPERFEFWQGRANRLHDRVVFTKQRLEKWEISRLAP